MHLKRFCLGLGVLSALMATSVWAQKKPSIDASGSIYRQTLPNGTVVYTDQPDRSVKIDKTLVREAPPRASSVVSDGGGALDVKPPSALTPGLPGTAIQEGALPGDSAPKGVKPGSDRKENLQEADAALEKALKAAKDGVEPLAGERSATVSGHSRLNDSYRQRQADLQNEVDKARAIVDKLEGKDVGR